MIKFKTYFLAICFLGASLPCGLQAADVLDTNDPSLPPVRPKSLCLDPVTPEVKPGALHLLFNDNLGVVDVDVKSASEASVANQSVQTSIQSDAWINLAPGTYTVKVTDAVGAILLQSVVAIP